MPYLDPNVQREYQMHWALCDRSDPLRWEAIKKRTREYWKKRRVKAWEDKIKMSGIKIHGLRCDSCINWEPHCKSDLGEGAADCNYCARLSRGFRLKPLSIPSVSDQNKMTAEINRRMKDEN